jgi:multiple sugar transport system substrate-binding protein
MTGRGAAALRSDGMTEAAPIRGMAWDHPRARRPLEAVSAAWSQASRNPVLWDARPLKDFEDQPLGELAAAYDLVLMDYPFTATAATSGLIVPVEDWASADYLRDQAEHAVGPSYDSYTWNGRQWALAIDAAAQVGAIRPDLLQAAGLAQAPHTWDDVARLARERKDAPARVAIPLNPNHAYCTFVSIGVAAIGPAFWRKGQSVDRDAALAALEFLKAIAPDLHPLSRDADPIAVSDRMAETDEILCVPLMFGYSNYSRAGFRRRTLRFGNAPRGASGRRGSVLGGVGIALSTRSEKREQAADLARTLASAEMQSGLYVESDGQPGHAAAWDSAAANGRVDDFFAATRDTMNQAFLRPRVTGHRRFQQEAGVLIHRFIWDGKLGAAECLAEFDCLAENLLGRWEATE